MKDAAPAIAELTLESTRDLQAAIETIDKNGQGIVFTVDDCGRLTGVLTDGDIRRALLRSDTSMRTPVAAITNADYTARPFNTSIDELLDVLSSPRIRYIPLVDSGGRLVDYASRGRYHRIPIAVPHFAGNELAYVVDCVKSGWVSSQGSYVIRFQERFARLTASRNALATSSGTTALHLGLLALGLQPGDEVIVPDLTFAASANAVLHAGGVPCLVDIDPDTWTLDPARLAACLSERTRGVIPVHLYGHPCDMDPILDFAREHSLFVLEDAAQALGACYKGHPVGSLGDGAAFSFFGNKLITTGEGGMLTLKDSGRAQRAKRLRDHGMTPRRRYWHEEVGYNYRMTNLQAALGLAQLERIDELIQAKARLAAAYSSALEHLAGFTLPCQASWAAAVCWLYTLRIDEARVGPRDALVDKLLRNGIETRPVFFPLHTMPPYSDLPRGGPLQVSTRVAREGLSLPSAVSLTAQEIDEICDALTQVVSVHRLKGTR